MPINDRCRHLIAGRKASIRGRKGRWAGAGASSWRTVTRAKSSLADQGVDEVGIKAWVKTHALSIWTGSGRARPHQAPPAPTTVVARLVQTEKANATLWHCVRMLRAGTHCRLQSAATAHTDGLASELASRACLAAARPAGGLRDPPFAARGEKLRRGGENWQPSSPRVFPRENWRECGKLGVRVFHIGDFVQIPESKLAIRRRISPRGK